MVSASPFRQELKRARSGRKDSNFRMPQTRNGTSSENTGLLSGQEYGRSDSRSQSIGDYFRTVFSKHQTAGMESENNNYVNILLVFVPLGIVAGATGWNPTAVFILNFFAIVPLAAVLSFATEEISVKLGQTMGGLLNATFGNAVELIVSIIALRNGEIRIVQSSMLGSILSNILLVLGCCFLAGGIHNTRTGTARGIEQDFNSTVASTMSSLMAVASASLIIPATLYAALANSKEDVATNILTLSHGTAIILLILYVLYLVFQLRTHANLFDAEQAAQDEDAEEPQMSPWAAAGILVVVTIAVAICAEYLVGSIDSLVATAHISKTFIGLILLPIVGNAAEHVTAVVVAVKDKMDLAMGVAIGSSMQIALLVTPFLVILGWIMDVPMTLHFETFETVVFFLSVLVVTYVIQDGKSNFLEGAMLLGLYIIIALAFLVYPDDASGPADPNPAKEAVGIVVRSVKTFVGL